ncbi:YcaO-like family protein [Evansella clarkii]|uniref:YcaO-like family protein n=1 Tax=Evansella clarkii TaxID=79879 RepID=UPI001473417B|nr:YcaO-like family protein [Evansella clarkii]
MILKPSILVPFEKEIHMYTPDKSVRIRNTKAKDVLADLYPYISQPFNRDRISELIDIDNYSIEFINKLIEKEIITPLPQKPYWKVDSIMGDLEISVLIIGEGYLATILQAKLQMRNASVKNITEFNDLTTIEKENKIDIIIYTSDTPNLGVEKEWISIANSTGAYFIELEQFGFYGNILKYANPACISCFKHRLLSNTAHKESLKNYWRYIESTTLPKELTLWPYYKNYSELLINILVNEIKKGIKTLTTEFITVNLQNGATNIQKVLPVDGCKSCEKVSNYSLSPLHLYNNKFGPIVNLEKLKLNKDEPYINIWTCSLSGVKGSLNGAIASAGAGGIYDKEVRNRAIYEGAERYSALSYTKTHKSKYIDLKENKINPREFLMYTPEQYKLKGFPYKEYNNNQVINWSKAKTLDSSESFWVPTFKIDLKPPIPYLCRPNSTGLAAGRTIEDAIISGLFEVIERDACITTWLLKKEPITLIFDEIYDEELKELIKRCELNELEITFLKFPAIIDIPCIVALLRSGSNRNGVSITLGSAVDPSYERAARKALIESILLRHTLINLRKIHNYKVRNRAPNSLLDHTFYYQNNNQTPLEFLEKGAKCFISKLNKTEVSNKNSLNYYINKLTRKGYQGLWIELTEPEIKMVGIYVVRVLIQGAVPLEPDNLCRPLGSRRLNLLSKETKREINPYPHPFA